MNKRQIGHQKEALVGHYLKKLGYKLLACNYTTKYGEIDIIAQYKTMLVFIEVKYRKNHSMVTAQQSVSKNKQTRIIKAAQHYLRYHRQAYDQMQFDVIAVADKNRIEHIPNAFWADHSII